jgi:ABC-type molybdate transport system permease subunit
MFILYAYLALGILCVAAYITASLKGVTITVNAFNRPVRDPILRYLTVLLVFPLVLVPLALSIPLHVLLLALGRRAFLDRRTNHYTPSLSGFRSR